MKKWSAMERGNLTERALRALVECEVELTSICMFQEFYQNVVICLDHSSAKHMYSIGIGHFSIGIAINWWTSSNNMSCLIGGTRPTASITHCILRERWIKNAFFLFLFITSCTLHNYYMCNAICMENCRNRFDSHICARCNSMMIACALDAHLIPGNSSNRLHLRSQKTKSIKND